MAVTLIDVRDVPSSAGWKQIRKYQGLSTDTKPTSGVGSDSTFYELDTKKIWTYDENNVNAVTSNGWWEV